MDPVASPRHPCCEGELELLRSCAAFRTPACYVIEQLALITAELLAWPGLDRWVDQERSLLSTFRSESFHGSHLTKSERGPEPARLRRRAGTLRAIIEF